MVGFFFVVGVVMDEDTANGSPPNGSLVGATTILDSLTSLRGTGFGTLRTIGRIGLFII